MVGVRLVELSKRFGDVVAVHPLDLEVEQGELLVLLGPSGCGKSTVLRMIAGVEEPSGGQVWIGDRRVDDVEPAERDVAMVFQSYALYPHMTVQQNLSFGLRMRKASKDEIGRRVTWASSLLGLDRFLQRRPGQLSGGQRQRVALGRAMVREPSVFLFDEPLSNLDARLRAEMRDEIASLHRRLGTTMVFVTHDQVEAMSLGQRIAILDEGVLQQCGSPLDVYREPANLFVARFVGTPSINTVQGFLGRDEGGPHFVGYGLEVRCSARVLASFGEPSHPFVVGVRPEDVELLPAGDAQAHLASEVQRVEALGAELLVHVAGPGEVPWVVRAPANFPAVPGARLSLRIRTDRAHLFDGESGARLCPLGDPEEP
ncbi:MAG: ABC transporter ATP-binding protein [Gemmatimonadota bacterium]|jgi:ABC-type sugar transport system ATPase subunit